MCHSRACHFGITCEDELCYISEFSMYTGRYAAILVHRDIY